MKISIVTISFNQAPYLKKCIDSVLSQEGVDLEYIVVDPGSTDGSRELIESYGNKLISVFKNDNGPADGLNIGFEVATGEVYGFINSDDYFLPGALRCAVDFFSVNENVDVVSGSGYFVDGLGKTIGLITPSKFSAWLYAYQAVTLFQQGSFFRANIFKDVGGFNPENKISWDGELFVDFSLRGGVFSIVNDKLAIFRMDGTNISSGKVYFEKLSIEHSRIFEKIIGRRFSFVDNFTKFFARLIKLTNFSYIIRRFRDGNFSSPPHC